MMFFVLNASASKTEKTVAQEVEFYKGGKLVAKKSLKDFQNLFQAEEIRFVEPHEKLSKLYEGHSINKTLEKIYGKDWETSKTLSVTCADGYKPSISVNTIKNGQGYIAFKETTQREFKIRKQGKMVNVGPLYIIWNHKMTPAERNLHLNQGNWPYQAIRFDLK